MKKILLSLGTLVVVGAIVAGATIAFYSDTETSNGNIFVAGSIDLKVDHTLQTYNGVNCETCSLTIYSDAGNTQVVAKSANAVDPTTLPHAAVLVSNPHTAWATNPPAQWIWATNPTLAGDDGSVGQQSSTYTFERTFNWNGPVGSITLNLSAGGDNEYKVYLNGNLVASDMSGTGFNPIDSTLLANFLQNGLNTIRFEVTNLYNPDGGGAYNNPTDNPGGLLYYLVIHRADCQAGSEFQNACRLWTEKDLATGDTFFNFGDVKPADWGTNVISLHVSSNDAYACLLVGNKDDEEHTLLSPETALSDAGPANGPNGELSKYLNVFTWRDTNGNGVYDTGETALGSGPLSSLVSIMSMDSSNPPFLAANTSQNIGLVWCAGTLTTPVPGSSFVCNGSGMLNDAQSDSFTASLTAYAEQVRNNGSFLCSSVPPILPN